MLIIIFVNGFSLRGPSVNYHFNTMKLASLIKIIIIHSL